jgi:hypothetical protein
MKPAHPADVPMKCGSKYLEYAARIRQTDTNRVEPTGKCQYRHRPDGYLARVGAIGFKEAPNLWIR